MRCPFCQHDDNRVVDSREGPDGDSIRRRRECVGCNRRFTTYERIDQVMPMVVKKDDQRESWDRTKVLAGLHKACEKRPVAADEIERAVADVERWVTEAGLREIPSSSIGEAVMDALKTLDDVAYVRFASVYKSFRDIEEFMDALETISNERRGRGNRL
jgi:transcriptional repressor NrdR